MIGYRFGIPLWTLCSLFVLKRCGNGDADGISDDIMDRIKNVFEEMMFGYDSESILDAIKRLEEEQRAEMLIPRAPSKELKEDGDEKRMFSRRGRFEKQIEETEKCDIEKEIGLTVIPPLTLSN